MKKYYLLFILSLLFIFCKSNLKVTSIISQEASIELYFDYIKKDTTFINALKNYYSDLKQYDSLNFFLNNYIKPINTKDFPIFMLIRTKLLKDVKNIEKETRVRKKQIFDSIYNFKPYKVEVNKNATKKLNCNIQLTFSKKTNNLLPLKIQIIDENIDKRILYKPRLILYTLELNNKDKVVDSSYLLFTD